MRYKFVSITQRLRLPCICALCNQHSADHGAICGECRHHFRPIGTACYHCALPLPDGDFLICGYCTKKPPHIDQMIAAYRYEEPLRTLLHEFKFHEGLYLSSFLATLILDAIPQAAKETECLIPVPMHPKRLQQRGFNQAAELAKKLGRRLSRPCELTRCKKIINTASQASLNEQQRKKNLRKAFKTTPLPYSHVTLIDDLYTTGNTVNELAKTIKDQGVSRVDVWCVARAVVTAPVRASPS